jgi:hypothetical protein
MGVAKQLCGLQKNYTGCTYPAKLKPKYLMACAIFALAYVIPYASRVLPVLLLTNHKQAEC